ncbi:hypothetical protein EDEG_01072 [Edhazardia aedis USNM 41457]|uniref:Uncharacterized protein n=1 Tax=Edhazardia aedis (strain USNM 41457) TaxID=1003232 RepID=J9DB58_EDHAE|nr:hypothetical protein EDEG_01072 [Edhazardia aedis USNM 41457]|eukprot:EJW04729.1 hypothetical protein EDEG_01072 [Edhazardia aedis USNM 41457]
MLNIIDNMIFYRFKILYCDIPRANGLKLNKRNIKKSCLALHLLYFRGGKRSLYRLPVSRRRLSSCPENFMGDILKFFYSCRNMSQFVLLVLFCNYTCFLLFLSKI